ncbi:hypothetical protein [Rathayibacter sp. VKM Ac-2754]|nr:hypothetical protein [Rathayibacter sp. VKM Ac-2754]MWV57783.1 hypothetical protein [Rathayibacter sp. VKM Ac-2754]
MITNKIPSAGGVRIAGIADDWRSCQLWKHTSSSNQEDQRAKDNRV